MRYREVKKGMKVRVKKIIMAVSDDDKTMKKFIGKIGKVSWIDDYMLSYSIHVSFGRGSKSNNFNHKELKEVK